ncbi:hypothetical protein KP014_09555 [Paenibacillus sophorae]|uniref:Uncharacterized protein n=1 Tax=Paenibacillus sophorae TaxID=1333845 RepID=A0ABX8HKI8_9BACL|nr:hypothetical protein KP014_09555 [Paenibacillus sophorae]
MDTESFDDEDVAS